MAADVDIANRSLVKLGQNTITALTDSNDVARTCNTLFEPTIKGLFGTYPWRFGMKQSGALTDASGAPAQQWQYNFALPNDFVAGPYAVYDSIGVSVLPEQMWRRYDQQIYANVSTICIDYGYRVATAFWPAWFEELAVLAFAAAIAEPITEQSTKAQYYQQLAFGPPSEMGKGGYFRLCRQQDAQTGGINIVRDFALMDARLGAGTIIRRY
jgi:hypothetical protein